MSRFFFKYFGTDLMGSPMCKNTPPIPPHNTSRYSLTKGPGLWKYSREDTRV